MILPNIRELFLPDPNYIIAEADLDRADLQVVIAEAEDRDLRAKCELGVDLHIANGLDLFQKPVPSMDELIPSHPNYHDHYERNKKIRQFAKSFIHGCVTAGHEVLTPSGWVPIESYIDGTPIMVWSQNKSFFEIPHGFNRDLAVDFVSFEGESQSIEMTWDHRVPYDDKGVIHVSRACEIPSSARIPVTGNYGDLVNLPEATTRLIAALQADGSINISGSVTFHFRKERKIQRLKELLKAGEYTFNETLQKDGTTTFYIPKPDFAYFGKHPRHYLLTMTSETLDNYLDELKYWDGHVRDNIVCHLSGTDKEDLQWMQTIAVLRGYGTRFNIHRKATDTRKDLYRLSINNRQFSRISSHHVKRYQTAPRAVYCPQTSTGFFFIRRNNKIMVTGNTNYGGGAPTMAKAAGCTVQEADRAQRRWFSAHPGIKAWHERTLHQLQTTRCVWNRFGFRRFYFDRIDGLLPEALAWIPQSTVAIVIDTGISNIYEHLLDVELLLQVHDSVVLQYLKELDRELRPMIREELLIQIPYDPPLTIGVGLKISESSWGATEEVPWEVTV